MLGSGQYLALLPFYMIVTVFYSELHSGGYLKGMRATCSNYERSYVFFNIDGRSLWTDWLYITLSKYLILTISEFHIFNRRNAGLRIARRPLKIAGRGVGTKN